MRKLFIDRILLFIKYSILIKISKQYNMIIVKQDNLF